MRKIVLIIFSLLSFGTAIYAQNDRTVIVRAGTRVDDYFPFDMRYRYSEFIPGILVFRTGNITGKKLNYNILTGNMDFIQGHDTLALSNSRDLRYVFVRDTFYFDNGYIEIISGGDLQVGLKQYFKVSDVVKKGAYGTDNRSSFTQTYNSFYATGPASSLTTQVASHKLVPAEDIELTKVMDYFLCSASIGFVKFTEKNVIKLLPQKKSEIKTYLKLNHVKFDSRDDLLKFAGYLNTL
jgi:hypothetical protein